MKLTKKVNIFDQTKREVRCIAREHDYLGTGEMIVEPELEVGRIYTYIHGRAASYGNVVFLQELPARWGYQAYLFEELQPYDEEEYSRKSREWLINILDRGKRELEDRKARTPEEKQQIRERIRELVIGTRAFEPSYAEGHDQGAAYWIYPVEVRDSDRIEYGDIHVYSEHEISIPKKYFDPLLTDFFTNGIDPDLPINAHRYSTDDCSDGLPIYGFEWYLQPNFYTYQQIERILFHMNKLSCSLGRDIMRNSSERQKERLRITFAKAAEGNSEMTYEDAMKVAASFYRDLSDRIGRMMAECLETNIICVMGP